MEKRTITPLAAFDITPGSVVGMTENWLAPGAAGGYHWLHLDIADPAVEKWVEDNLPAIAGRALLQAETRPRCDRLQDGLILNLRAVNLNPKSDPEDMVSLRMWVTKNHIVSARHRKIFAVDEIRQNAAAGKAPPTIGAFLGELVHDLTIRIEDISIGLEDRTDDLEEEMLGGTVINTSEIADLRQTVLKMRRFINPQREALVNLASINDWVLSGEDLARLRESSNRTRRIIEELDTANERLSAIQDKLDADHANAIGRNSYILSVVAAIFLPLGFLTGLFGVNVAGMPGTEAPSAFWVLTAGSVVSGIALFLVFKFAKWL